MINILIKVQLTKFKLESSTFFDVGLYQIVKCTEFLLSDNDSGETEICK